MFSIEKKVVGAARMAGLITASAVLTGVGAAFLTAATWIYLSAAHSSGFAALIIGLVYCGAGIVVLAIALSRATQVKSVHSYQKDTLGGLTPMQLVLVSFLQGLDQGKNAKRPY